MRAAVVIVKAFARWLRDSYRAAASLWRVSDEIDNALPDLYPCPLCGGIRSKDACVKCKYIEIIADNERRIEEMKKDAQRGQT